MPAPILAIAAIISAATAAAKGIAGGIEKGRAKKAMDALKDPFYKIQDEYYQNRNLAGSEAQFGLPSTTLNQFTQGAERGLGSAISAANQVGGGVDDIGRLLQGYTDSLGSTAGQDAMLHTQKIQEFMNRNRELAGQKTMQSILNERQPFENKLRQLQQNSIVGQQNMWGGASDLSASISNYATARQNQDLNTAIADYYNRGNQPVGTMQQGSPIVPISPNAGNGQNFANSDYMNTTGQYAWANTGNSNLFAKPQSSNPIDVNSLSDEDVSGLLRRMNFIATKR